MMNKLYVVGGKSRVGKEKIAKKLSESRHFVAFSTDAFRPNGNDELAWLNLAKFLKDNAFESDVLIEGVAITPERLTNLDAPNFSLERPVFIGYSRPSHADTILRYAQENKDWVFQEMEAGRLTEDQVRGWMTTGIPESAKLKEEAEKFGYKYFDVTDLPFDQHLERVKKYILRES